ncbi:MAG: glycine reductase [Bacilli bacterium]|nr:glycine reductase [Bacilli bacterium]
MKVIVTNNPQVNDICKDKNVIYLDGYDFVDVLTKTRDLIHQNYILLTHPLASNLMPDKTIYKTVILEKGTELDYGSLNLIEDAVFFAGNSKHKLNKAGLSESILKDLQLVDLEMVKDVLREITEG